VQAVFAVLPKLKVFRHKAIATPVSGAGNLATVKRGLEFTHTSFEFVTTG
jgi:hypothetical protein